MTMRFCRFTFIFVVCWTALFVESGADNVKKLAEEQCKTFKIIPTYHFIMFPSRETNKNFKECCNDLMGVIRMIGILNARQLFTLFVKYFQEQSITEARRTELMRKLQEIAKALKASSWDQSMKNFLYNKHNIIKDDDKNLRLNTILSMLSLGTRNNEVYWDIMLHKTFAKCHQFMHNIDSILEDESWRRFLNIYLQWWNKEGKVSQSYIQVDGVMEIYKLCLARKDCLDDKALLSTMFGLFQDKDYNCGDYFSHWKLPTLKACLDNDLARKAPFPVLVIAISNERFFKETVQDPETRFDGQDVWTELLGCGTHEGCLLSTVATIAAVQSSNISGRAFRSFMKSEVKEKGRHNYDGYAFLVLLYRYSYKNRGKNRFYDSIDVAIAENEHFLRTLFRIQNDITPLSVNSIYIKHFTFQPMAALAEKTSLCEWSSKNLIDFIIMAQENCLKVEDFADFLELARNLECESYIIQTKMKEIVQFINSLNIQFNKKSIWKKLIERNKDIELYNIVIANNNLFKVYGSNSAAHNIFYYFFRSRKMLSCDRPKTFELIYKDVIERKGSLKEYDFNEIIEFRCLEEQKLIADEKKKKKEEEEEEAAAQKRRRDEASRRKASSSTSSTKTEESNGSMFSWLLWHGAFS